VLGTEHAFCDQLGQYKAHRRAPGAEVGDELPLGRELRTWSQLTGRNHASNRVFDPCGYVSHIEQRSPT
jgi:hypothetical protein